MEVAEGQALLPGHLVIALVKLLVGLLAEGTEIAASIAGRGRGGGNKTGLDDSQNGGVKDARAADVVRAPCGGFRQIRIARPEFSGRLGRDRAFCSVRGGCPCRNVFREVAVQHRLARHGRYEDVVRDITESGVRAEEEKLVVQDRPTNGTAE